MIRTLRYRHAVGLWAGAVGAYGLLTCVLTWPLPLHLSTHLLGDPGGDLGTYVWNLWVFRHELLRHAHLPVSTGHVFAFSGGADFSLHNYAPIAGAIGAPLIAPLGVVGAFNAVMCVFITASGLAVFALARQIGLRALAAWAAGALFMASPVLTAKETAHFSLVIAPALPLFLLALIRTLDTERVRDAALVGAVVAAAYYSDAYYGIYCVIMGAFVLVWRFTRVEWPETVSPSPRLERSLNLVIGFVGALATWRVWSGSDQIVFGPLHVGLRTLYTPQLVLLVAVGIRTWLAWRPVLRWTGDEARIGVLLRLGLLSVAVCLVLLLPQLVGMAMRVSEGRLPQTDVFWRSSPRGLDVLAYVVPNTSHPWFGDVTRTWFMPALPDAFPEFVGSFSLVALSVIALGAYLRLLPRVWVAFTAFFFTLSLGPFVHLAGINTYTIGPWALLRYVPVVGMARAPSRFAIVTVLGLSLLVAFAIDGLTRRYATSRWTGALLVALVGMELLPAPRPLFSAAVPDVYQFIAVATNGDESGTLLELPTGIRDGTSSVGNFNAESEFFQTAHRRPLVGGYLSRVSRWRKRHNDSAPMLRALFALSEGRELSSDLDVAARRSRDGFLRRSCVKFVIVNKQRATGALRVFAVEALRLSPVYEDAGHALLVPDDAPACDPPMARRGLYGVTP